MTRRRLPMWAIPLLLATAAPAQEPWAELAAGGARADKALARLKEGGRAAARELLAAGLASAKEPVRTYAAQLLPPRLCTPAEADRLFQALLAAWGRIDVDPPLPEKVHESLTELFVELGLGQEAGELADVAGWGDQERLLACLAAPGKENAAWAKAGKEGREARVRLAQALFPATDARGPGLAAKAVLASGWNAEERGPVYWLVLPAMRRAAYPGDEVVRARIKSILLDKPEGQGRVIPVARVDQAVRSLPLLTSFPEALPLVRAGLLEAGKSRQRDQLWTAARELGRRSSREVRSVFWAEGVPALKEFLAEQKDEESRIAYFFLLYPALGGETDDGRPVPALGALFTSFLTGPMQTTARKGQLTNDLFVGLVALGVEDLLAATLAAAPAEHVEAILGEGEEAFRRLGPERARELAGSRHPRVAQVGKAAQEFLKDTPSQQPDKVLLRLLAGPEGTQVEILAEGLRRRLEFEAAGEWWRLLVEEDSGEGAALARKHPESFRSWLAAAPKEAFAATLGWCVRRRVDTPWRQALPEAARKALLDLVGPGADPELPGLVQILAGWLETGDREALARRWLETWSDNPEVLDGGDAPRDWTVLKSLFAGREAALAERFAGLLQAGAAGRVAETAVGGLVRLGKPPAPAVLETLLAGETRPTAFMALHACAPPALLERLAVLLKAEEEEGWRLFLKIAWGAHAGHGPGPELPSLSDPAEAWWELARAGRFPEIYLGRLEEAKAQGYPAESTVPALAGLSLCARTQAEKDQALARVKPFLAEPRHGLYWDALLAAAALGDAKAGEALDQALASGRRFFVQQHLLPWLKLDRARRWVGVLVERGFPASGFLDGRFQETLAALVPELDPVRFPRAERPGSWAAAAWAWWKEAKDRLAWDPVERGWRAAP